MSLMRLQKFLSQAGVASRRAAEVLISSGRVKVNGVVIRELGVKVDPARDTVQVSGRIIKPKIANIYLAVNKPAGYVTSRRGQYGRPTVYELLPENLRPQLWTVGRLDYETEGLLIFTNDGELTQKLTHPSFEHVKQYEVTLDKKPAEQDLKQLRAGMDIGGHKTAPATAESLGAKKVIVGIHEGQKRQIRRMFGKYGYKIDKLVRISIGRLDLNRLGLKPGEVREVGRSDIM